MNAITRGIFKPEGIIQADIENVASLSLGFEEIKVRDFQSADEARLVLAELAEMMQL